MTQIDANMLLQVKNLRTHFFTEAGVVRAVEGVSFSLDPGETLGIVGESGCGKSIMSLSLMGLVPNPGRIVSGEVLFRYDGEITDLVKASPRQRRALRGKGMAMIFQEPMTSLNPIMTIGAQIGEALRVHEKFSRPEISKRVVEMLQLVGIPSPWRRANDYPHQLSGGMRQRAMIAMALGCNPSLLIADEPTTALDVTIQAQILDLIKKLQERFKMAVILVTHDLGIVAQVVDRVKVMYAGRIVEEGRTRDIFKHPRHPYTKSLLNSIPPLRKLPNGTDLPTIPGNVPDLAELPSGCTFQDRCPRVQDRCRVREPDLEGEGCQVRCYFPN